MSDGNEGRCPECGEDEMDGGRCYYCGFHDYNCGICEKCAAQGMEAGTGETREAGLDPKDDSPVGNADAPNTSPERRTP